MSGQIALCDQRFAFYGDFKKKPGISLIMHENDVITSGIMKKSGCLINYELSGSHS